ncbi:MAG: hypothetical protein AAGG81_03610 [Chlamydiota bacterium]
MSVNNSCLVYGNVAQSGIWNEEGKFVEKEFQKLFGKSIIFNHKAKKLEEGCFITPKIFNNFLESQRQIREGTGPKDTNPDDTDDSVASLFTMLDGESDMNWEGEKVVTVAKMRKFCENATPGEKEKAEQHPSTIGSWFTSITDTLRS